MRKMIAGFLSCICIITGASAAYGADYKDVTSKHWAFEAVGAMSNKAIIKGYPDGSFRPDRTVTYGEFIKMALIVGTGGDAGNSAAGHWALNYYNRALELKYFSGYDIDKSQLGDMIPRTDMALIISAVLGDVKIENYDEIQKGIKDVTYQTEHEYDITKSYAAGILTGYTDDTFRPDKTLSRAESAAVIHRLADESKRILPIVSAGLTTSGAITTGSVGIFPTSGLLDMTKLTPDKTRAVSVHFTDTYELYNDASEWGMKIYRNWDGMLGAFDHELRGHIYLIKDREIFEYCDTTPKYDIDGNYLGYQRTAFHSDVSKADYIICVPSNADSDAKVLIKAIINPFKQ